MARKYSKKASKKVERAMRERKRGQLRSGRSRKKVTSRKQAIAIGLSEARRAGEDVPPPPAPRGKKKGKKKATQKKRATRRTAAKKRTQTKRATRKKSTRAKRTTKKRGATKRKTRGRGRRKA